MHAFTHTHTLIVKRYFTTVNLKFHKKNEKTFIVYNIHNPYTTTVYGDTHDRFWGYTRNS